MASDNLKNRMAQVGTGGGGYDTDPAEDQKATLSKRRGQAAAQIGDPAERMKFVSAQGNAEADDSKKSMRRGGFPRLSIGKYNNLSEGAALLGY